MIEIKKLTKKFDETIALNDMNCKIYDGSITGLTGSNGSGKSTLLRTLSGVYAPDGGEIIIDDELAFDNPSIKEQCFFISDFPYFYNDSTLRKMADLYRGLYSTWDEEYFQKLCSLFPIGNDKKIINMSKGMQRQASLILAFSTRPKYLFLDEIFDGLDPVIRKTLKSLLIQEVTDNNMTCIIASHNLREIDDICDNIILLHAGNVIAKDDTDTIKNRIHKIQLAFTTMPEGDIFDGLDVRILNHLGNYYSVMIKGNEKEIMDKLNALNPAFIELLPATLEEVFINEMEGIGYGK
ncbi:MAG: ABC transporter ATP-binding protein [Lachnospiraceae bacterium]|jgi:ABC-2 type transport system ATP-binding protein|nr:ABC transporter ATP-binding protein [Lachnospiraceae bacterium]